MDEIVYDYYFIHGGFSSLARFIDGQNLFITGISDDVRLPESPL